MLLLPPPVPPIPQPPQVREAALGVDHAVRLPWLRVGFVHPQGSCPGWACKPRFTVGDLGPCVWLCVCVCLLGSLVCPGRCPLSCLRRTLRRRPSNSLVPWLAQVSKACVALFAACLSLACFSMCGVLVVSLLPLAFAPPCGTLYTSPFFVGSLLMAAPHRACAHAFSHTTLTFPNPVQGGVRDVTTFLMGGGVCVGGVWSGRTFRRGSDVPLTD